MDTNQERATHFEKMMFPTCIYALIFTVLLYNNFSSFTMPIMVLVTMAYCNYCMDILQITGKKNTVFYYSGMLLLGVSSFLTGNGFIIFCNTAGIILLLICLLLHNFFEDTKWGFGKYVYAILGTIFGSLGMIPEPFLDASCYQKEAKGKKHSSIIYVIIGVTISLPLLLLVILLLCSADIVFYQFVSSIDWKMGDVFGITITFFIAFFAAYCGFRYLGKGTLNTIQKQKSLLEPLIAETILALLSIVYVFFCGIQMVYLFYGKMQLPDGYTYAEYAREGFFQLLFVCILNVILVLAVLSKFEKRTCIKVLLTVISCCTYIMVASSAFRMSLYVQNYQLTFLRILVFWGLAVIALFLVGILIQIFKEDFPLFRYGMVMFAVCYLALSFGKPDYWIATYNLNAAEHSQGEKVDFWYLEGLSTDAAPAIAEYMEEYMSPQNESDWIRSYVRHVDARTNENIRKANISHIRARSLFEEQIKNEQAKCEEL